MNTDVTTRVQVFAFSSFSVPGEPEIRTTLFLSHAIVRYLKDSEYFCISIRFWVENDSVADFSIFNLLWKMQKNAIYEENNDHHSYVHN